MLATEEDIFLIELTALHCEESILRRFWIKRSVRLLYKFVI